MGCIPAIELIETSLSIAPISTSIRASRSKLSSGPSAPRPSDGISKLFRALRPFAAGAGDSDQNASSSLSVALNAGGLVPFFCFFARTSLYVREKKWLKYSVL